MPTAEVILKLQSQVAPQIAQTADAYKTLSAAEQKAEQGAARYAQSLQKVALQDAKTAVEEQRLAVQTANAARAQDQASLAALRLATAQEKQARSSDLSGQFADGLKSGLLGIVGPAALATAALAAVVGTANSFKEAFAFTTQLGATTQSITTQLRTLRDSGQVFSEAQAFADRYKITQADITSTLQASIPVFRASRSSTTDLLTQLSLLQATTPDRPISEAARALRELSTGDVTTIKEVFNVSANDALKMKNAIQAGADPVQVLARYLKESGASMELLEQRTQGAVGAMNDLARAQEDFTRAQGELATSKGGIAVVQEAATAFRGLANLLNGDVTTGVKSWGVNIAAGIAYQQAYNQAIAAGKTEVEATAFAQQIFNQVLQRSLEEFNLLPDAARVGSKAILELVPAAYTAAAAIDALNSRKVLPHINDTGPIGGAVGGLGDRLTSGLALAAGASNRATQAHLRLIDSEIALASAKGDTARQLDLLRQKQALYTKGSAEYNNLQAQIIGVEKQGGAGRISAAESTALRLSDIARTSGDDRLRIERENLERLRDQQEDFDIRRSRSEEDYQERRRGLLARGQRAQAAELARDHAKDVARAQEDFDRERRRTIRNNQESLGDQGTRVGNRVESVNARTAARGGTGAALPSAPGGGSLPSLPAAPVQGGKVAQLVIQGVVNLDGAAVGTAIWPTLEVRIDNELAISLAQVGIPGAGQAAVGGPG